MLFFRLNQLYHKLLVSPSSLLMHSGNFVSVMYNFPFVCCERIVKIILYLDTDKLICWLSTG